MIVYCGVDFPARLQTTCFCDTFVGEIHLKQLHYGNDDVRGFVLSSQMR
jgi:hypothetical protein